MKKHLLCLTALVIGLSLHAQRPTPTTNISADTTWLSVYNTGALYLLKAAPFGEKNVKKGVVQSMVFAMDSILVKKNEVPANFKPFTLAELKLKAQAFQEEGRTYKALTQQEKDRISADKGKRTCDISTKDLKGRVVLLDFDNNCDPTYKCLQAQKAGAIAIIVIHDSDKRDSIALAKGKYDNDLKIPCFSIGRKQGDSLRMILPSQTVFFTPKANIQSLIGSSTILTIDAQADYNKSRIEWVNNSGDKNDYFTVQKFNVTTGEYTDMETTNSRTTTGLSQYTVYDITPDNGDNIYRIKLVQIDGTVYISDLKTVNFNTENITIFPNPVEDNINIAFKGYENKAIDITLYNMQGQPIMTRQIAKMESDLVTMPVGEKMVAGQYMLRIKTNGKRETLKSFTVGK